MQQQQVTIHGRRVAFRTAGRPGAPTTAVLIHGITQDSSSWADLAPYLAADVHLVAIDLPGHGDSENPPGDHSMGAYASMVRDLLFTLDLHRATVIGHSMGGGVALQFAYQFPESVERLVLIDAGGLGPEVSPLLRAASLPGADLVLRLLASERGQRLLASVSGLAHQIRLARGADLEQVRYGIAKMTDPEKRHAFLRTVQGAIGLTGQRVSANDKLYLAQHLPTLLLWGARDRVIPLAHATEAHQSIPGSRLRVLRDAGHFPHVDEPAQVAEHILDFLSTTEPAQVAREQWGDILRGGSDDERDTA